MQAEQVVASTPLWQCLAAASDNMAFGIDQHTKVSVALKMVCYVASEGHALMLAPYGHS